VTGREARVSTHLSLKKRGRISLSRPLHKLRDTLNLLSMSIKIFNLYYWFRVGEGTFVIHHLISDSTANKKTETIITPSLYTVASQLGN
jgi:hypothetical protein